MKNAHYAGHPTLMALILAMSVTATNAQTRIFRVAIVNDFDRPITLEAEAGNGNYEGEVKRMNIRPGRSEAVELAFNNRSSIGYFDGHVNLKFRESNTMGKGHFRIRFDRGGRIYRIDHVSRRGDTQLVERPSNNWFQQLTNEEHVGIMKVRFVGPLRGATQHSYRLHLSSLLRPVQRNISLIVGYLDGPRKITVFESTKREQEATYQKFMRTSWSVSSTIEASYGGASGSVTGGAEGSDETTIGNRNAVQTESSRQTVVDLSFGQMRFTTILGDIVMHEDTKQYAFRPSGVYSSSSFTKKKDGLSDLKGYYTADPAVRSTGLKLEQADGSFMKVVGN